METKNLTPLNGALLRVKNEQAKNAELQATIDRLKGQLGTANARYGALRRDSEQLAKQAGSLNESCVEWKKSLQAERFARKEDAAEFRKDKITMLRIINWLSGLLK